MKFAFVAIAMAMLVDFGLAAKKSAETETDKLGQKKLYEIE